MKNEIILELLNKTFFNGLKLQLDGLYFKYDIFDINDSKFTIKDFEQITKNDILTFLKEFNVPQKLHNWSEKNKNIMHVNDSTFHRYFYKDEFCAHTNNQNSFTYDVDLNTLWASGSHYNFSSKKYESMEEFLNDNSLPGLEMIEFRNFLKRKLKMPLLSKKLLQNMDEILERIALKTYNHRLENSNFELIILI